MSSLQGAATCRIKQRHKYVRIDHHLFSFYSPSVTRRIKWKKRWWSAWTYLCLCFIRQVTAPCNELIFYAVVVHWARGEVGCACITCASSSSSEGQGFFSPVGQDHPVGPQTSNSALETNSLIAIVSLLQMLSKTVPSTMFPSGAILSNSDNPVT